MSVKEQAEKIRELPDDILLAIWKAYQVKNLDVKPKASIPEIKGFIHSNPAVETSKDVPSVSTELLSVDREGNVVPALSTEDYLEKTYGIKKLPKKLLS